MKDRLSACPTSSSLRLQVAVMQVPILNIVFSRAPLAFAPWLACTVVASGVLIDRERQSLRRLRWGR